MLSPPDLLQRHATSLVLWRPANDEPPPALVIGTFAPGNPPTLASERTLPLTPDGPASDLWSIALADCGLQDGAVYHYFFEVTDGRPEATGARVRCTDPTAWTVDWRLLSPESGDRRWPAAVVRVENGRLVASDPEGGLPDWAHDAPLAGLAPNHRTVIYELPAQWTRRADENGVELAAGTFRDVLALVEPSAAAPGLPRVTPPAPRRAPP